MLPFLFGNRDGVLKIVDDVRTKLLASRKFVALGATRRGRSELGLIVGQVNAGQVQYGGLSGAYQSQTFDVCFL